MYQKSLLLSCPFQNAVNKCPIEKYRRNGKTDLTARLDDKELLRHNSCFYSRSVKEIYKKFDIPFQENTGLFDTEFLTPTEVAIAKLVVQGKTNREIAAQMSISKYTVENHRKKIRNKLGVDNPVRMVWEILLLV